jgi:GDPmannose 4,6-dehydratase
LYAKRDWGHAKDYVEAMWKIMNQKQPKDYVVATGKQSTVKNFVNLAAKELKMKINWKGKGINEKGYYNNKTIIQCDKKYFRPLEVDTLLGDASKARKELRWKARFNLKTLIQDMIREDVGNKDF